MSIAPSSPPLPSEGANMWKMPSSKDRTLLHAIPVPRTIARVSAAATTRTTRCTNITLGYLRPSSFAGSQRRRGPRFRGRARLDSMSGRLVITGAGGQLGSCLWALATDRGRDVLPFTSSQWDITDAAAAERIIGNGDVVINCAAYTDVDGAESDEAGAYAVNAAGPEHIARACARVGARLIHVSTDYVFSGEVFSGEPVSGDFGAGRPRPYEPGDETDARGVYARSKLAGERAVLAALPDASQGIVVRTAWLYTGGTGKDFVAVMRRLAAGDGPVNVVDVQTGSPTYVADLAAALLQVADDRVPGPI